MWRVARPCLSGTAPVVTGQRAEEMGTGFFVGRIRLTHITVDQEEIRCRAVQDYP